MLLEFLESHLTPCPPWKSKRMFLKDSAALRARYGRCRTAWASHLGLCKSFVLSNAFPCKKICVLGSGFLLDLPWRELSSLCDELWLIDAVHPLPILLRAKLFPTLRPAYADLLFPPDISLKKRIPTCAGHPVFFSENDLKKTIGKCEIAISCNVLSQLEPSPPLPLSEITRQHARLLNSLGKKILLLTDVSSRETTPAGTLASEETLVDSSPSSPLPAPSASWDWLLAPRGEMLGSSKRNTDTRRVEAFSWDSPDE